MNLIAVFNKLRQLDQPIFSTNDVAIILDITNKYANTLLRRLCSENMVVHLRRGLWGIPEKIDPLSLPDYLTAPSPSYVSLQSALHYHGLISQIPIVIYAVSLARTRRYETTLATYSIHHINPILFIGFDVIGDQQIRMASVEKALFDFYYFKSAKSKLFTALPELEIPESFDWKLFSDFNSLVINKSRQAMINYSVKALCQF